MLWILNRETRNLHLHSMQWDLVMELISRSDFQQMQQMAMMKTLIFMLLPHRRHHRGHLLGGARAELGRAGDQPGRVPHGRRDAFRRGKSSTFANATFFGARCRNFFPGLLKFPAPHEQKTRNDLCPFFNTRVLANTSQIRFLVPLLLKSVRHFPPRTPH